MTASMDRSSPSPAGSIIFFSVSDETKVVYSYNGGGDDLEPLAESWLEKAKRYHAWHTHTEDSRTFGFLMREGHTYFAIGNDAGTRNAEIRSFLERLRDAYHNAPRKEKVEEKLVHWVIRVRPDGDGNASMKAELSQGSTNGGSGTWPSNDNGGGGGGAGEDVDSFSDRVLKIDGLEGPEAGDAACLSRSLSERLMLQQRGRRIWWRQLKIVAVVDALLCFIFFAIWLVVCRGFRCVS